MHNKGWVTLRVLLNRFHQGTTDALQHCLSLEETQLVLGLDISSQDIHASVKQPTEYFRRIHYSWLPPVLEQFPDYLRPSLMAALDKKQRSGLAALLGLSQLPVLQSEAIQSFLLDQLHQKFDQSDILPREYLPHIPLTPLLDLSKEELVEMVSYLGLYDLAEKIRHIVDKNRLKELYQFMTPSMQQFLSLCLRQKEKLTAPGLDLDKWKGHKESLMHLLQQRGLLRLGKALAGQNPHFQWHIVHTFDTGRGAILKKYFNREEAPRVTQVLIQEILNILNFMKKKSTT